MQPRRQTLSAVSAVSTLPDDALLRDLHAIAGTQRRVTAELILHLGEVDARRLHVEKGFSSLFVYCVGELHFSEDEACRRIEVARLARRFPAIYPLLDTGAVSLTVLALLKPHLADDNHGELLGGVSGSSIRQAREWIAARFPRPDVPSAIRKQAERCPASTLPKTGPDAAVLAAESAPYRGEPRPGLLAAPAPARIADPCQGGLLTASPAPARIEGPCQGGLLTASPAPARIEGPCQGGLLAASPVAATLARARVEPLSQDRFLVKFTASRALRDKLELARDLTRHANPTGALERVLERAIDLLIAEQQKQRQGQTARPQKSRPATGMHVTRAARREVVARDGWRCAFVADDGRRCDTQAFLEFDHETPKGRGGSAQAENLRLLCRAHNRLAAERVYGRAHVSRAIADSRGEAAETLAVRDALAR
jgi:5-methylcytosine-specific restriction endonuclease McrA